MKFKLKIIFFAFLSVQTFASIFAGGSAEQKPAQANGLRNWDHTLDISTKKPGLYNIVIEGRDRAGNVTVAGPFNIHVDPESDVPHVQINNPLSLQRVGGNLNIVGTAVDDDGIGYVELSLNGAEPVRAQGKEFWSLYFSVAEIEDGAHTLSAIAHDINGVPSKPISVVFNLDKHKPNNQIISHQNGVIVSGNLRFSGLVEDANQVASVELSEDGGKQFKAVYFQSEKNGLQARFDYAVDTKKFPDGPKVLWVRSRDKTGSVNASAFLVFVDNTIPDLRVIYPGKDAPVNGKVTIFGAAADVVGLKSLSWRWGDKKADMALVPGNPFFSQEFDLSKQSNGNFNVVFIAQDTAGNIREFSHSLKIDNEGDLPVASLHSPQAKSVHDDYLVLTASARDDDGIAALWYQLGQSPAVRLEGNGNFVQRIELGNAGQHTIGIWAEDIFGVKGKQISQSFQSWGPSPIIVVGKVNANQFSPGMTLISSTDNTIEGSIASFNGLKSLQFWVNGAKAQNASFQNTAKIGELSFKLALGKGLPFGILNVELEALDNAAKSSKNRILLFVRDDSKIQDEPSIVFEDKRIVGDRVQFDSDKPLDLYFAGGTAKSVRLLPESNLLKVNLDGNHISLLVLKAGITVPSKVVLTDVRGHSFETNAFVFATDYVAPQVTLAALSDKPYNKAPSISGKATDNLKLAKLQLSTSNVITVQEIALPATADGSFKIDLPASIWDANPDGLVIVKVTASDVSGLSSQQELTLIKDTTPPLIRAELGGNGFGSLWIVFGTVEESGLLQNLSYELDGSSNTLALLPDFAFSVTADTARSLTLNATDAAGNTGTLSLAIGLASGTATPQALLGPDGKPLPAAKPNARILYPKPGATSSSRQFVIALDNSLSIDALSAKIGGKVTEINYLAGSGIAYGKLEPLKPGTKELNLELGFLVAGKQEVNNSLRLSFDAELTRPKLEVQVNSGNVSASNARLSGAVIDSDGASELRYQVDNSAQVLQKLTDNLFSLDFSTLKPGKHTVKLFALDSLGNQSQTVDYGLTIDDQASQIIVQSVRTKSAVQDYRNGINLTLDDQTALVGQIIGTAAIKEAKISLNNQAEQSLALREQNGVRSFEFKIPRETSLGKQIWKLTARSENGQTSLASGVFYVLAAPNSSMDYADGLRFADPAVAAGEAMIVSNDKPLGAYLIGRPIKELIFSPPAAHLSASFEGRAIKIGAQEQGPRYKGILTAVSLDGDRYSSPVLDIITDSTAPEITLEMNDVQTWFKQTVSIKGTIRDNIASDKVSWTTLLPGELLAEKQFIDAKIAAASANTGVQTFTVDELGQNLSDGLFYLVIKASDTSGNQSLTYRALHKYSQPPLVQFLTPPVEEIVNGYLLLGGIVQTVSVLKELAWTADGTTFNELNLANDFSFFLDTQKNPLPRWAVRARDLVGNEVLLVPQLKLDPQKDLPVIEIQTPPPSEVQRNNFPIAGMVFDDDGVKAIYYRIDHKVLTTTSISANATRASSSTTSSTVAPRGRATTATSTTTTIAKVEALTPAIDLSTFVRLEGASSFSIPIDIVATGDNQHVIEMVAEDINGVLSPLISSTFRISTAEPQNAVLAPSNESSNRRIVAVNGKASDKNGIKEVRLSFDNGNSWHRATGTENWNYQFDTRTLKDGTYAIYIKTIDMYETEGDYTTLINIDNTPPSLILDDPVDGLVKKGKLYLSGRVDDQIGVSKIMLDIIPADAVASNKSVLSQTLALETVIQSTIDVGTLSPGWYTVRLSAFDRSDNVGYISRDIQIADANIPSRAELVYPRENEILSGFFTLSGQVKAEELPKQVGLYLDDTLLSLLEVSPEGWFHSEFSPEMLEDGKHNFTIKRASENEQVLQNVERTISYAQSGPWIRFTSQNPGDYVSKRPWLEGKAGYLLSEVKPSEEGPELEVWRQKNEDSQLVSIELSFDNGKTFSQVANSVQWRARLETQNFATGPIFILARAKFKGGKVATSHIALIIDEKSPEVTLLFPGEEGRFNGDIPLRGTANDNFDLEAINVTLREGDKAGYEVPSGLQGMYVEAVVGGLTIWEVGVGLTFFDENVKLQTVFGFAPAGQRFDGYVMGAKLIANVLKLPGAFLFGPDLDFFSMSLGVGAQFNYATMSGSELAFGDNGVVLGAAIVQLELARLFFEDLPFLRTYGLYMEGQFWFVSSDVLAEVIPKLAFGLRVGLF